MRIINVLEIINGIPRQIESFPIYEPQLSEDVIRLAEDYFLQIIYGKNYKQEIKEDEIEFLLDNGWYDDDNGHNVYIIWSN